MGLSEQDRSRLHTIEKALRAQYPGLARRLTRDRGSRRWRVAVGLVLLVLVPVGVVVWMLMVGVALLGAVLLVLAVIALGVLIRRLRAVARQISQDPLGRGSGPAPGPDGPT